MDFSNSSIPVLSDSVSEFSNRTVNFAIFSLVDDNKNFKEPKDSLVLVNKSSNLVFFSFYSLLFDSIVSFILLTESNFSTNVDLSVIK